jgi:hypothetical protein
MWDAFREASASRRRIACVTLVTYRSRSDAFVIGNAPVRLNANSRNS